VTFQPWVRWGVGAALALVLSACGPEPEGPGPGPGPSVLPDAGTPDSGTTTVVDADYAVVRFNADGSVDSTFGAEGAAVLDVGGVAGNARDSVWGGAVDGSGRILLFGTRKGEGTRVDSDRIVARLTPAGALDTSFGKEGIHTLNIANLNDTARHGFVQADGKIVTSGYMSAPTGIGTQSANRVVLLRLNENGTPDPAFGFEGVVSSNPLMPANPETTPWGMAEAYAVAPQGTKYVTTGYGRRSASNSAPVDLVAFRYTDTGALDTTWGNDGVVELDVAGAHDRGRNLAVLPDGRVLMVGSATPMAGNVDALVALYSVDGQKDTALGENGYALFDLGGTDEAFFGVAVDSVNHRVAAVGHRAGAGAGSDDDAILFVWSTSGESAPLALAVPLSESEHDRFTNVTFDSAGKIYASGYIGDAADRRMAVARFNVDGTLDSSFGTGGVATRNVSPSGTEEASKMISVQADGKVVLIGVTDSL